MKRPRESTGSFFSNRLFCLILAMWLRLVPAPGFAWDTIPHQRITKAAIDSLPRPAATRFATEAASLVNIYSIFPDRYLEMERFGFVRNSPGPRDISEIRMYCVRPDGQPIHGITGNRETDIASLLYLFERIVTHFSEARPAEAAKYSGVLSHFIADSLSPSHALGPGELREVIPASMRETCTIDLHSAIERSLPAFTLGQRKPRAVGPHLVDVADTILQRCSDGAAQNRKYLPSMVKAACLSDEKTLDVHRLRAGTEAAEILADALYTLSEMSVVPR